MSGFQPSGATVDVDTESLLVRELRGHSGCSVSLYRRGENYFVRKISGGADYNSRFVAQIEKQERLAGRLRVPKIISRGALAGRDYCDMEYINALDFRTHLLQSSVSALPTLADKIIDAISAVYQYNGIYIDTKVIIEKLKSVTSAIRKQKYYHEHASFLEIASDKLKDEAWDNVPLTDCHGDLTTENMLFLSTGEIVFIDLLDGPLQSVWLDIAKLVQDLASGWSARADLWCDEDSPDRRLLRMLNRYLLDELMVRIESAFPEAMEKLPKLRALQAMRVLPYVNDRMTFARVVMGMKQIKDFA